MVTPHKFIQSSKSYQSGDKGFCKLASVSTKRGIDNIGFWFKVVKNDWKLVLSIRYASFGSEQPLQTVVIIGDDKLHTFLENARRWAEKELDFLITGITVAEEVDQLTVRHAYL